MGNFKTENLELSQIQMEIISNYGSDVKSKFVIGDALTRAKQITKDETETDEKAETMFDNLVKTLPFGKVVANKYIAIANTKFLKELSENDKTIGNLPSGYNHLFEYTKKEIAGNPEIVKKLTEAFTKGTVGKGKSEKSTTLCSATKVLEEIGVIEKSEVELLSLATLKVKKSAIMSDETYEGMQMTYENYLKVKSAITKIKEEVLKYDFITLECDLDKLETASKKISKKNKDLYGTSKQTNLVSKITKEAA